MRFRAIFAATCLLPLAIVPARAQPPAPPPLSELAARAAKRYPQPVRVGDLIGRTVLQHLESQPQLGHVRDVVRRIDGGADVIIDYGGLFALSRRPIRVPVEAMSVLGQYMEILEFTPEQLQALPTFEASGAEPLSRDGVIRVALGHPAH